MTEGIRRSEIEQTIPQSCFACQLPLHKGAKLRGLPFLIKGRCHEVTEGIRSKSAKGVSLVKFHPKFGQKIIRLLKSILVYSDR